MNCEYCGSGGVVDTRGNCINCGAPIGLSEATLLEYNKYKMTHIRAEDGARNIKIFLNGEDVSDTTCEAIISNNKGERLFGAVYRIDKRVPFKYWTCGIVSWDYTTCQQTN